MKIQIYLFALVMILAMHIVIAQSEIARENRLKFGNTMVVENIGTSPSEIAPGAKGFLKFNITNTGLFGMKDIMVQVTLPSQFAFFNDLSKRKIATLESGESKPVELNIIAIPSAEEGVYTAQLRINYLNFIGEEKQDNDTFAIIIKSKPKLFVELDSSDIYGEKTLGDVTVTFVNEDLANIRFLTIELEQSPDYEAISSSRKYIGDLDSDDFESVDFRIKLLRSQREIPLLLKATYKDALNNDYSQGMQVKLVIRSPEELGIKTNWTILIVIGAVIVLIIFVIIYKIYKRRKSMHYAKEGFFKK